LIIYASDEGEAILDIFEVQNASLPLKFTTDPHQTKMFGWLNDDAYYFEERPMTYNAHTYGIAPSKFETDAGLSEMFALTSVSYTQGNDSKAFAATIEGKKYPFFGT
jgi:hypothetical protein